MREQLNLFTATPADSDEWWSGLPDRSGAARYLHLVRASDDPRRLPRADRKGDESRWRLDLRGSTASWESNILELLADRRPRTFNRIVLELTGGRYTADVAFEGSPDAALWLLVDQGRLEYRPRTPIFFRRRPSSPSR